MNWCNQKFRTGQHHTWGLHTLVVNIGLFGAMNALLNYNKLQTKIDQMVKEWEIVASVKLEFVKFNI